MKKLPKRTLMGSEGEVLEGPLQDELVADHEWESLLHAFDNEPEDLAPGAGGPTEAEEEDLWKRLSSTRWLKDGQSGNL